MKIKFTFLISVLLFCTLFSTSKAQQIPLDAYKDSNTNWYMLRENNFFIHLDDFLENSESLLGLHSLNNFQIKERNTDFFNENTEHIRFKQFFGNYEIEDAILLVHITNDTIDYINADLVYGIENTPIGMQIKGRSRPIAENTARQKAFEALGINPPSIEQMQRVQQRTTSTSVDIYTDEEISDTLVPNVNVEGNLLIARKSGEPIAKESYVWAWKYGLTNNSLDSAFTILIDANSGEVADVSDAMYYVRHQAGSLKTLYYGDFIQDMTTSQCDLCINKWALRIEGRLSTSLNGSMPIDYDNIWTLSTEQPATTAHWAMEKIWNFWSNYYGRNSYDNQGNTVNINAGISNYDNAGWSPNGLMQLGYKVTTGKWYSAIDIIGHEFMHGILHSMVGGYPNLSYGVDELNEQGAIREGLCDIMGKRAEYEIYKNKGWRSNSKISSNDDFWLFGDKIGVDGIRSMNNPNYSSYQEPNNSVYSPYIQKAYDNAGILDRWFVLLSAAVNIDNAADVVYFTLRDYATNTTDFRKFKNQTIAQAQNHSAGKCNDIAKAVLQAWKDVGVAPQSEVLPRCYIIGGGGTIAPPIGMNTIRTQAGDVSNSANSNSSININKSDIYTNTTKVTIYPIPSNDILHIDIHSDLLNSRYVISAIQGSKLWENTLSANSNLVNISQLDAGIYILSIYNENTLVHNQRILIL